MLGLSPHGLREMLLGTLILGAVAAGLAWLWWPAALLPALLWVWLISFFRDPERPVPADPAALVSPADGTVSDITPLDHVQELGGPAVRVGIFLSIFNVHVNRSPCDARVLSLHYKPGRFFNALNAEAAAEHNESNTILLGDVKSGRPIVVVRQIVGLLARRIVCTLGVGDVVRRGQRIGMLKFGSRTELYIPLAHDPDLRVSVGSRVRGGCDIIAVLRAAAAAPSQQQQPAGTASGA